MENLEELERRPTKLLHAADELRKLLIENPDLPLLVFAGDSCNNGEYSYMSCSSVYAEIGEFLDCEQEVNDERCYTDRDEFEEDLGDRLCDDFEGSDEEWNVFLKKRTAKYDPYWKKCIILHVDN